MAVAAVLATPTPPTRAATRLSFRSLGATSGLISNGRVAFTRLIGADHLTAFGNVGRPTRSIALPAGCPDGTPSAAAIALVLLACAPGSPGARPLLMRTNGTVPRQVRYDPDNGVGFYVDGSFYALGRQWLLGLDSTSSGGHAVAHVLFNWHTGEMRYAPKDPNLDARDPSQRRRIVHGRFRLLHHRSRPDRDGVARDRSNDLVATGPRGRRIRLSGCPHACTNVELRYGVATWSEGARILGVNLSTRRQYEGRIPGYPTRTWVDVQAFHLRGYLYVEGEYDTKIGGVRAYRARLTPCCLSGPESPDRS